MIRENGLYTLMGSKPISTFYIADGMPETEEGFKVIYAQYLSRPKRNPADIPLSYEEFHKEYENTPLYFRHRQLWETWEATTKGKISPRYRFVLQRDPLDKRNDAGLFINVPNTLYVLKFHYSAFARITGLSFDPDKILDEISDNSSPFWRKAFESHYLMGLLFGYGEKNAALFEWEIQNNSPLPTVKLSEQRTIDQTAEICFQERVTLSDLKLPLFGVYSLGDPTIKKYQKEKKYITKQLRGKDFTKVVWAWLSGDPPIEHF